MLLQEQQGGLCEALGDRSDVELTFRRVRHAQLIVGHSVALAENNLPLAGEEDNAAEVVTPDVRLDVGFHAGLEAVRCRGLLARHRQACPTKRECEEYKDERERATSHSRP